MSMMSGSDSVSPIPVAGHSPEAHFDRHCTLPCAPLRCCAVFLGSDGERREGDEDEEAFLFQIDIDEDEDKGK